MRIRQPLAVTGFSFAGILLLCGWMTVFQVKILLLTAGILILPGIFLTAKKKGALLLTVSVMAVCAAAVSIRHTGLIWETAGYSGQKVQVSGTVSRGNASGGWFMRGAEITAEENTFETDLLITGNSDLLLNAGENIYIEGTVGTLPTASQQSRGAKMTVWANSSSLRIVEEAPAWSELRNGILSRLERGIRRTMRNRHAADLMTGILTGDTSSIPDRIYADFQRSGLAHILCISGLHLSMLAGIFTALFSPLGRKAALFAGLAGMAAFVWLTGAPPSSVRAFLMASFILSSELLIRDSTPMNALGGAVLIMLIPNPALVYRMGFLLSVTSVAAVSAAAPAWVEAFEKVHPLEEHRIIRSILSGFCSIIAVTLLTSPVMAVFMGYTPLLSPLFNLVIIPVMPVLLCCGILAGVFSFAPAGMMAQKILEWIQAAAEAGAELPVLPLRMETAVICLIFCLLAGLVIMFAKGKRFSRAAAGLMAVMLLCAGSIFGDPGRKGVLKIVSCPLKKSSSIVLQSGRSAVVIGCGSSSYEGRKLSDFLLASGVADLSAVIIPEDRSCYTGGAYSLLTSFHADKIISPPSSRVMNAAAFSDSTEEIALEASAWALPGGMTLTVRPGKESAVFLIEAGGLRICAAPESSPVPYPADFRLSTDKKRAAAQTTMENYAIMKSSGFLLRPDDGIILESGHLYLKGAL